MSPIFFLLALAVAVAVILLCFSTVGSGLVDEARQWWRLRSMQLAGAVAVVPQLAELYLHWAGDLWPQVSAILMQLFPGESANTISVIGAAFAIARLVLQTRLPRIPKPDPTDAAGADRP